MIVKWMHVTSDHDFHFAHEKYQTLYLLAASYFSEKWIVFNRLTFFDYLDESSL